MKRIKVLNGYTEKYYLKKNAVEALDDLLGIKDDSEREWDSVDDTATIVIEYITSD